MFGILPWHFIVSFNIYRKRKRHELTVRTVVLLIVAIVRRINIIVCIFPSVVRVDNLLLEPEMRRPISPLS